MQKSANIPRFIKLSSKEHIGMAEAKLWHKTVMKSSPPGIMASIPGIDANGALTVTRMVRRSNSESTQLIIPVTRDLLPLELRSIADSWQLVSPPGNFTISTNPTQDQKLNKSVTELSLNNDEYQTLCVQLAKVQHDGWIRNKASDGWSYGAVLSLSNKLHPLMRPWDELPCQYRDVNTNNPENFLNFLNNQGFAVVKQSELGSLLQILRNIN